MQALPSDRISPEESIETASPPLMAAVEPTLNVEPLEDRVLLASDTSPAGTVIEPAAMEPTGPALIGPAVPGMPQDLLANIHIGAEVKEAIADISADKNSEAGFATQSEKPSSSKLTTTAEQHAEPIEQFAETDKKEDPGHEELDGRPEPEDSIATIEPEDGSRQKSADYERLIAEGANVLNKLEATGVIDEITADIAQQAVLREAS